MPSHRKPSSRPPTSPLRRHWGLSPDIVFLNHGSFGACPKVVLEWQHELRTQMEAEPVQFLWRRYEERLEPSRALLAEFLRADPRDLVFVTNATTAVNAVLRSLPLSSGDEVLTTSLDYNACRNVLLENSSCRRAKVIVANVPFPLQKEDQILEAVLERVTSRTRLVMLDHVTSNSALVLPVGKLAREIERKGVPVLIDGAHAPGMLPLDLDRLGASYYTGNLHKWVCAPKGCAFLWARRDRQAGLQPAVISHGNNTARSGYGAFQDRFDWAGTFDPSAWFMAGRTLQWMSRVIRGGWPEVYRRNHTMAVQARRLLCSALDLEPPCPERLLGCMATLPLPARFQGRPKHGKIDAEQLELYDRFSIEVPLVRCGAPQTRYFRVSAHIYNTLAEYRYLASALKEVR